MRRSLIQRNFLVILLSLFFTGCLHAQTFSLAFNPVVGSTHKVEITKDAFSGNQISVDAYNADIVVSTRTYYLLSFTTLEYADNSYKIALTVDSSGTFAQTQTGVSSSEEYYPVEDAQRNFDYFSGASIILHVSNQGELLNMEGIEDLANAFPVKPVGIDAVTVCYSMIQELVHLAIPQYVCESIETGQTWQGVENVDTGMYKYVENTQYTITELDNASANVSLLSSLVPVESDAVDMMGMKMKMTFSGSATGSMKVDRNTGWVVVSEWQKNVVVGGTVENPPMQIPSMQSKEKITVKSM